MCAAQKEAEQEKEVAAVPKHKDDHDIDMPEMDENILPPPPLPALLNPFERVTARPNVAPVTFKKHTSEKLSSARTFSIASLQQYTNSFSQENLLGGGMLGTVYRAELPDGKVRLFWFKLEWIAKTTLTVGFSCQMGPVTLFIYLFLLFRKICVQLYYLHIFYLVRYLYCIAKFCSL